MIAATPNGDLQREQNIALADTMSTEHATIIRPPVVTVQPLDTLPGGLTVGVLTQPRVPVTRAEKERAKLQIELATMSQPVPPQRSPVTRDTTEAVKQHVLVQSRMQIAAQQRRYR